MTSSYYLAYRFTIVCFLFSCSNAYLHAKDFENVKQHSNKNNNTKSTENASYVNPFIGTGGIGWNAGSETPSATLPFGMVKLGPDTITGKEAVPYQHCSGYWYLNDQILGFSHNHLSGTGLPDQGNLRIMPLTNFSEKYTDDTYYRSYFAHDTEVSIPGYYAVTLDDNNILAELTASAHTGFHRYTYPSNTRDKTILIDIGASLFPGYVSDLEAEISHIDSTIDGFLTNQGSFSSRYGGQTLYFSAGFKDKFDSFGVFQEGIVYPDETFLSGDNGGIYLNFDDLNDNIIEFSIGISYVSVEQARLNRYYEDNDVSFNDIKEIANNLWNEKLSVIEITNASDKEKEIFYTALYHSLMMPTYYTDVNGMYMGFDLQSHYADGFSYYTDMSLWDTYRTEHPLLSFLFPNTEGDIIESLNTMYKQIGYIDRWPQGNGPTECMIGDSPAIVISDSYLRGVRNFDVDTSYEALYKMASIDTEGTHRERLRSYLDNGYIPVEKGSDSVSMTLEYSYNDGALYYLSSALDKNGDANIFYDRALYYRNLWNESTSFMQARYDDGTFVEPFDPESFSDEYSEGNAYQWSWYSPLDVSGLIGLFGGNEFFEKRLDYILSKTKYARDSIFPDTFYWHGNESDIHVPYLYHFIGKPEKSINTISWVIEKYYNNTPDGMPGNDDGGALSSWYVWSSLGLFPWAGSDVYLLTKPLFERSLIHLENGDLEIIVESIDKNPLENRSLSKTKNSIQKVFLNDKEITTSWLKHEDLANGGILKFIIGRNESSWGKLEPYPPSISTK